MAANDRQVGGEHYKKGGEEHWDRAWRLNYDPFQYIITKWVERWKDKGGLEDLKKAQHALEKYIEVNDPNKQPLEMQSMRSESAFAATLRDTRPTQTEALHAHLERQKQAVMERYANLPKGSPVQNVPWVDPMAKKDNDGEAGPNYVNQD